MNWNKIWDWLNNLDNVFDTINNVKKLTGNLTEKNAEEVWLVLKGSGDPVIDNRLQQIAVLKADRKEIINKLNGSGGKGAKGLGQKVWASIARRLDFSNKTAHQDNLQDIDINIARLENLIQRREHLVHDNMEDDRARKNDSHISEMKDKKLTRKKWNQEATRAQETHQEEIKKQKEINRKQEIINAQEEALKDLEHQYKLSKFRNNYADPDYKSLEDLKEEVDIAKLKLELQQEKNNLDGLTNAATNPVKILEKQAAEASAKAVLIESEIRLKEAEYKRDTAPTVRPNPNQDLIDKIARSDLEVKYASLKAQKNNAKLLADQAAKPEKSQAEIALIQKKYASLNAYVDVLMEERKQITKNSKYTGQKQTADRVLAIDAFIKEKYEELDALILKIS